MRHMDGKWKHFRGIIFVTIRVASTQWIWNTQSMWSCICSTLLTISGAEEKDRPVDHFRAGEMFMNGALFTAFWMAFAFIEVSWIHVRPRWFPLAVFEASKAIHCCGCKWLVMTTVLDENISFLFLMVVFGSWILERRRIFEVYLWLLSLR